jgi:hypothetical protein
MRLICTTILFLSAILATAQNCNLGYKNYICISAQPQFVRYVGNEGTLGEYQATIYVTNNSQDRVEVDLQVLCGGLASFVNVTSKFILDPGSSKSFAKKYHIATNNNQHFSVQKFHVTNVSAQQRAEAQQQASQQQAVAAQIQHQEEEDKQKGTVLFTADLHIALYVDGTLIGNVNPAEPRKVLLSKGEHLVTIRPIAAFSDDIEDVVDVQPQTQIVKQIKLRDKYGVMEDVRLKKIQSEQENKELEASLKAKTAEMERQRVVAGIAKKYVKAVKTCDVAQLKSSTGYRNSLYYKQEVLIEPEHITDLHPDHHSFKSGNETYNYFPNTFDSIQSYTSTLYKEEATPKQRQQRLAQLKPEDLRLKEKDGNFIEAWIYQRQAQDGTDRKSAYYLGANGTGGYGYINDKGKYRYTNDMSWTYENYQLKLTTEFGVTILTIVDYFPEANLLVATRDSGVAIFWKGTSADY